eukprot:Clim_evm20s213 gene=Clim_evmTU20s213
MASSSGSSNESPTGNGKDQNEKLLPHHITKFELPHGMAELDQNIPMSVLPDAQNGNRERARKQSNTVQMPPTPVRARYQETTGQVSSGTHPGVSSQPDLQALTQEDLYALGMEQRPTLDAADYLRATGQNPALAKTKGSYTGTGCCGGCCDDLVFCRCLSCVQWNTNRLMIVWTCVFFFFFMISGFVSAKDSDDDTIEIIGRILALFIQVCITIGVFAALMFKITRPLRMFEGHLFALANRRLSSAPTLMQWEDTGLAELDNLHTSIDSITSDLRVQDVTIFTLKQARERDKAVMARLVQQQRKLLRMGLNGMQAVPSDSDTQIAANAMIPNKTWAHALDSNAAKDVADSMKGTDPSFLRGTDAVNDTSYIDNKGASMGREAGFRENGEQGVQCYPLTIFCGTWNMGNAEPSQNLRDWLGTSADLVCIALQEATYSHPSMEKNLMGALMKGLGDDYRLVKTLTILGQQQDLDDDVTRQKKYANGGKSLVSWIPGVDVRDRVQETAGIRLVIFATSFLVPWIGTIHTNLVKTGLLGGVGYNKGGIAISIKVMGQTLCFIGAHLAAHQEKVAERNNDYYQIIHKLRLPNWDWRPTRLLHACTFFMGDLNYRIDQVGFDEVKELNTRVRLGRGQWSEIQEHDQLNKVRQSGQAWYGFQEAAIDFAPTYKFNRDSDFYDEKSARIPAWCDRVLWSAREGIEVQCDEYGSCETVRSSDHRPVYAEFTLRIPLPTDWVDPLQTAVPLALSAVPSQVSARSEGYTPKGTNQVAPSPRGAGSRGPSPRGTGSRGTSPRAPSPRAPSPRPGVQRTPSVRSQQGGLVSLNGNDSTLPEKQMRTLSPPRAESLEVGLQKIKDEGEPKVAESQDQTHEMDEETELEPPTEPISTIVPSLAPQNLDRLVNASILGYEIVVTIKNCRVDVIYGYHVPGASDLKVGALVQLKNKASQRKKKKKNKRNRDVAHLDSTLSEIPTQAENSNLDVPTMDDTSLAPIQSQIGDDYAMSMPAVMSQDARVEIRDFDQVRKIAGVGHKEGMFLMLDGDGVAARGKFMKDLDTEPFTVRVHMLYSGLDYVRQQSFRFALTIASSKAHGVFQTPKPKRRLGEGSVHLGRAIDTTAGGDGPVRVPLFAGGIHTVDLVGDFYVERVPRQDVCNLDAGGCDAVTPGLLDMEDLDWPEEDELSYMEDDYYDNSRDNSPRGARGDHVAVTFQDGSTPGETRKPANTCPLKHPSPPS